MAMRGAALAHDPCPQVPTTFLNPARMARLGRELKKRAPPQEEAAKGAEDPHAGDQALREAPQGNETGQNRYRRAG
jgi:hypothetical protein